jgi:hypothetical protein
MTRILMERTAIKLIFCFLGIRRIAGKIQFGYIEPSDERPTNLGNHED